MPNPGFFPEGYQPSPNDNEWRLLAKIAGMLNGAGAFGSAPTPNNNSKALLLIIATAIFQGAYASATGPSAASGAFTPAYNSATDLKAIPTAGGAIAIGKVIPVMNLNAAGQLSFVQLLGDGNGYQPNDYNASTNNVSYHSVL